MRGVLGGRARAAVGRAVSPLARWLLRRGVSPDAVTVAGTLGVSGAALGFYPRGEFFVGTLVITAFVLSDALDGTMARLAGRSTSWGAFLDSTLDRVADAAVFGGLLLWFAGEGEDRLLTAVTLWLLVAALLVSYARARAEGLGLSASVGVAERTERLMLVLVGTGLAGLGVPYVQAAVLWLTAALSTLTVAQRVAAVRRQTRVAA